TFGARSLPGNEKRRTPGEGIRRSRRPHVERELLLLLIVRAARSALGGGLGSVRIRDAGLAGAGAVGAGVAADRARVGGSRAVALHLLAALLADDLDLLGAVRRRVVAGAHLLALVQRGDAAGRAVDADDLGRVVDLERQATVEGDAVVVLVDAGNAAPDVLHGTGAGTIHRGRAVVRHRAAAVGRARSAVLARGVAHVAGGAALAHVAAVVVLAGGRRRALVLAVGRAGGAGLAVGRARRAGLAGGAVAWIGGYGAARRLGTFDGALLRRAGIARRLRFFTRARARRHQGSGCDCGADLKFHVASSGNGYAAHAERGRRGRCPAVCAG